MARYEIKGVQPPADVLQRLANIFGVSIDFLVVGDTDEKAIESLKDAELVADFKRVAQLPEDERKTILKVIKAYIRDFNTQKAYAS
jgi:transcriptional regulator with XRE-family HTH domain